MGHLGRSGSVRGLAVVHPFPSILNAALVAALFLLAGGDVPRALLLGLGMLGIQFAIGAINDVADADLDASTQPAKPIAAGLLRRSSATWLGIGCAVAGVTVYAAFGALPLLLGIAMLAIGLAYDLGLKRAGFGWLCFAVAFPLLPLSTWLAATGGPPPQPELLLPVAALAGPALQLSNGLVDLERDRAAGLSAPVTRLGRTRSVALLGGLLTAVYGLAWLSLLGRPTGPLAVAAVAFGTALAAAGLFLSSSRAPAWRERGWQSQALALALLAAGWLAAVT